MVYRISSQRQTVLEVLGGGLRIVCALYDFQDKYLPHKKFIPEITIKHNTPKYI